MLAEQLTFTQLNGLRTYQGTFFRYLFHPSKPMAALPLLTLLYPKAVSHPGTFTLAKMKRFTSLTVACRSRLAILSSMVKTDT